MTRTPTDTPEYRRCPDCGQTVDWLDMVWLNGRCACPACYERRRAELDFERRRASDHQDA